MNAPTHPTDEQIAELKSANGNAELLLMEGKEFSVVAKLPTRANWRRMRSELQDDQKSQVAQENLLRTCLVWPELARFDEWCERRPGIVESFSNHLVMSAGMEKDIEKKLL